MTVLLLLYKLLSMMINPSLIEIILRFGIVNRMFEDKKTLYTEHVSANPKSIASGDFKNDGQWDLIICYSKKTFVTMVFGLDNSTLHTTTAFLIDIGTITYSAMVQNNIILRNINGDNHLGFIAYERRMDSVNL